MSDPTQDTAAELTDLLTERVSTDAPPWPGLRVFRVTEPTAPSP